MNRRTKKELIQIFKKLRESHAWSRKEAGMLSLIREKYEGGQDARHLMCELDEQILEKRRANSKLWLDLYPEDGELK